MKSPEPPPISQWKMPNPYLTEMLGQFIMAWALIEGVIEIGIGKQLGTRPLETSIVTAGLMFKARSSILMSLLNRHPQENVQALKLLKEIRKLEDRNDIMHGVIGGTQDHIWFNRRTTNEKFNSKIEKYDATRLSSTVLRYAHLSSQLMSALSIEIDDYLEFFQDFHNSTSSS
jgi:hypothetical protein